MNNKSIYLIYDAINCTPNGDPDNSEQRYNEVTKKAIVTDLRIKRFGRDKLNDIGIDIFYFYDKDSVVDGGKNISGAAARFNAHCAEKGINLETKKSKKKNGDEETDSVDNKNKVNASEILLTNFIDVRIFGGVLTSKENNAHITGALQFDAENESINEVIHGKNLVNRGITSVFPSKDKKSQGSMGRDSYLRYGLFCIKGRFCATTAMKNGATDDDLKLMLGMIWDGMKTINTRTKYGHEPIAYIIIDHPTKKTSKGYLGGVFGKSFSPMIIKPKNDKQLSDIYSREDYEFDFTPLRNIIESEQVEKITIYCDNDDFIQKHFSNFSAKCQIENPFDVLLKLL